MPTFSFKRTTAIVAVLFAPAAYAQQQAGTTLNQVVEQTLLSNPEIQAKYHDFRASMEGQNVARGGLRPQVNAQGFVGKEWRSNVPDRGSYNWSRPGYSVELRQLIFDGFRTSNDVKQAGYDKLGRFYELLATSDSTAYSAVQAYVDLQRYREMELLARQNYSLHEDTLKQIRERAESGVGRRVDLEQAGGRLALAQTNLMTESANLIDVQQRFQRITGMTPAVDLQPVPDVAGKLPQQPANFDDSLRMNPSFLAKQAYLQAANAGVASAKGAFSPKFEFVAATGRDREQPEPQYRDVQSSSVQLVMSYNLYRGGADSARVRQTAEQSYAARDVRDYTCRNVQQDLAVAWNNIVRLREQIPFLRDHEIATAKVRNAYREQFQIGQRSLLDLLDTENELFESRRALANGMADLQLAQYRWLALSHKILPALSVQPARDEMPEENAVLETTDEVLKLCNSPVPDVSRLAPVQVIYNSGAKPPTFVPADKARP
ncbi:TolC family outer membrane protein [Bordetella bronchiseptica]|uniref:Outer membrane protein n=3 Tax=Bordetella bronchiseptica TaxID=518 RepID=A0A0H3LJ00_BORBR|nr:TolC family outer membrane protein [Bordetella bronchiseptica]KAK66018.1 type I secretion outer membrane protein, TolC family [Bordetella bronchiseptica 980-2]KCV28576.1 type I secretion outer membrane protein, TolC family [Bordetella bronchiseptica 00-P-2730]KDD50210.1 type I secretion outer membrane protein, TolC family [Bordetella bronchiseptica OSU553]SHR56787.1 Outer membrane efflux protein BepC precursor [Mycobacteroides abscessus subsp. abscessus]AMG87652.1 outer membrane protein [Bo